MTMRQHEEDLKIKGADNHLKILWDRCYCQEIAPKRLHIGRDWNCCIWCTAC